MAPAPAIPKQTGHGVADTLADQFLVGVVARARHVIGDQGGQQAVDGTQHGQDEGRFEDEHHRALFEDGNLQRREALGNIAEQGHGGHRQAEQRADRQGCQGRGKVGAPLGGPAVGREQGDDTHDERREIDIRQGRGQVGEMRDGARR